MAQSEGIECLQFSDMIIGSLKWSSAVVKLKLLYCLQGNRVKTNGDLYHSTIWRSQESPIRPLTDDHLYQALNLHLTYALHLTIISPRLVQFSCKILHSLCYEGELWKKKSYCTVFPYTVILSSVWLLATKRMPRRNNHVLFTTIIFSKFIIAPQSLQNLGHNFSFIRTTNFSTYIYQR